MEGFRNEESAAMTELREECRRQEDHAAELNAQLQDRVDELMEKLNKYPAPMLKELGQDEDGNPVEVYATPRAEQPTTAGVELKPHETMSDLAGHAKKRLQSLFSTTPAGSNAPPALPSLPVRHPHREESNREPSVRSPTAAASEPDKISKKLQSSTYRQWRNHVRDDSSLVQTSLTRRGHGSMESLIRKPQGLS